MQEKVKSVLKGIIHPETQQNIVESGVVEQVTAREDKITVVLCFPKSRDPFAVRIKSLVEQMLKEQQKQGERLDTLEGRDGEMWRKATGYVVTTIISIIVGFVFAKLGIV